jgi:hypothetical protein
MKTKTNVKTTLSIIAGIIVIACGCGKSNPSTANTSTTTTPITGTWVWSSQQVLDENGNSVLGLTNSNDSEKIIFNGDNTISFTYPTKYTPSIWTWVTENGNYNYLGDSIFTVSTGDTGFLKLIYGFWDGQEINGFNPLQVNFETYQWPLGDSIFIKSLSHDSLMIHQQSIVENVYNLFILKN